MTYSGSWGFGEENELDKVSKETFLLNNLKTDKDEEVLNNDRLSFTMKFNIDINYYHHNEQIKVFSLVGDFETISNHMVDIL